MLGSQKRLMNRLGCIVYGIHTNMYILGRFVSISQLGEHKTEEHAFSHIYVPCLIDSGYTMLCLVQQKTQKTHSGEWGTLDAYICTYSCTYASNLVVLLML